MPSIPGVSGSTWNGVNKLDRILMVTLGCADLAAAEEAYCRHLHYRRVDSGCIPGELAQMWGLEAVAGSDYTLLAPEADTRHFIRLIRIDAGYEFRPFSGAGWNAVEILVNDVDSLADSLIGSPFTIVGPPADLSFTDRIRACQVTGPAGEAIYLTQIKGAIPGFSLPTTERSVAHCFVVILAAASLSAAKDFYRDRFAVADAPVIDARVTMLSAAFGLPRDHLHRISVLTLGNPGYLIEVDELSPAGAERRAITGLFPPGIAIVSFTSNSVPDSSRCRPLADHPYNGRQVGFYTGPSGKMLELIYS